MAPVTHEEHGAKLTPFLQSVELRAMRVIR
jgi:hypothetical protein